MLRLNYSVSGKKYNDNDYAFYYPEQFNIIEKWWLSIKDNDDYWLAISYKQEPEYEEFMSHYHCIVDNIFYLWT